MLKWNDVVQRADNGNESPESRVEKSPEQWRQLLKAEQFHVTREHGTERAFSSDICHFFEPGIYHCVCCKTPLFDASEKFDSGTGWPSFTQPLQSNRVAYKADRSYGMTRIEALCSTCDAHLGHVFPDGPQPSGLRYCMNAVALEKQA